MSLCYAQRYFPLNTFNLTGNYFPLNKHIELSPPLSSNIHTDAGVGVVGLDSRRTVVILRSVDDQDVGETVVILRLRSDVSVFTMNVRGHRHHQYRHISNPGYPPPPPFPPLALYLPRQRRRHRRRGGRELFKGLSRDCVLRRRATDPRGSEAYESAVYL